MLWEHELYRDMKYLAPKPFFHTFEAEDCIVAFNFADKKESLFLLRTVFKILAIEKQKRDGIAKSKGDNEGEDGMSNAIKLPEETSQTTSTKKRNKKKIKKGKKEKLTSLDIGTPQNFKHIGHVGWDSSGTSMGLTLQKFLEKAGVSDRHLKNEDTWNFILNFIHENGGMEQLAKSVEEDSPTPTHIINSPPGYPPPPPPPDVSTDLPKIPARKRSVPSVPPRAVPSIPTPPPLPTLEALPQLSPPFTSPVPAQREASSSTTVEDPRDRLLQAIRSRPVLRVVTLLQFLLQFDNVRSEIPNPRYKNLVRIFKMWLNKLELIALETSSLRVASFGCCNLDARCARIFKEKKYPINPLVKVGESKK
uniref:Neural Wiskott-Aldrich syndrome protein n=1 Tax=Lygus hesperus TaxID=30085 RepID=A0A0A9XCC5_LYGHE